MELLAIKNSSNVDAIGYAPDCHLLRIAFKDGSIYDYPNTSAAAHAALLAAPSKGKHLHQHFKSGTKLTCHVAPASQVTAEPSAEPTETEFFTPDDCCQSRLVSDANRNSMTAWFCPGCGQEWRWEFVAGVKHWSPHDEIMTW